MGHKVRGWLVEKLKKTKSGPWKIRVTIATDLIEEAIFNYYGIN